MTGADANIRIGFNQTLSLHSARLSYLGGKPSALAQLGGGFSFKESSLLATAALQGNHLRLSTDYLLDKGKFQYFAEVNTLNKPKEASVTSGTGACPSGYTSTQLTQQQISDFSSIYSPVNESGYVGMYGGTPSQLFVNGQSCLKNGTVFPS